MFSNGLLCLISNSSKSYYCVLCVTKFYQHVNTQEVYEIANYEDFVCNLSSCGLEVTAHVLFGRQSVTVFNTVPAVENERSSIHTHHTQP